MNNVDSRQQVIEAEKARVDHRIRESGIFLSHCAISPLHPVAMSREHSVSMSHNKCGHLAWNSIYERALDEFRVNAAQLLRTSADNVNFIRSTAEGVNLIANGYRFSPGDQVITYKHEYPSNYYPWFLQAGRGVELLQLPNRSSQSSLASYPGGWSLQDLEEMVTPRTRVVALSHVQFASGYAANLSELGAFCESRNIDLVLDVAQSIGSMPIYPEASGVAAVVGSGWKWLMGPVGSGIMYTSPKFRDKLAITMAGSEIVQQGVDYLDHTWHPHRTAKMFEYSTSPMSLVASLSAVIRDVFLEIGLESIYSEICRLQNLLLTHLDSSTYVAPVDNLRGTSGILALATTQDPQRIVNVLAEECSVFLTARGQSATDAYIRIAPHFYNTDEEMIDVASALNNVAAKLRSA